MDKYYVELNNADLNIIENIIGTIVSQKTYTVGYWSDQCKKDVLSLLDKIHKLRMDN